MDREDIMSTGPVPSAGFWADRRVLVTGHTGFKGAWLVTWLRKLGANVMGVSLEQLPSKPSLWQLLEPDDVLDVRADVAGDGWQRQAVDFDPELIIHLAAQSLVPRSYEDPSDTFRSNVLGTLRVMELLPSVRSLLATLVVTTDKVYDVRQASPFTEESFLGGKDPYSASKAATELLVQSWPTDKVVATARAGNVIGGGDWANHRLLPDLERAWSTHQPLQLRRPRAVRPWQHVLEPLHGYLTYMERLVTGDTTTRALNLGPSTDQCVAVEDVVTYAAELWKEATTEVPRWECLPQPPIHETDQLEIDSSCAATELSWSNRMDWRESVAMTISWYADLRAGAVAADLVATQLASYVARNHVIAQ